MPSGARGKHFAPMEVREGVAIIRIDGPGKMNTIDDDFRAEIDALWEVRQCCQLAIEWRGCGGMVIGDPSIDRTPTPPTGEGGQGPEREGGRAHLGQARQLAHPMHCVNTMETKFCLKK